MSLYLNKSYINSSGNKVTPVRYFTVNHKGRYILECSKCSSDAELFPLGSIETSGDSIRNKRNCCGCNPKGFRYSEVQYEVLVKRMCVKRGYDFKGFKNPFEGSINTYLKLYNPVTGNYWGTTTIQPFLNGVGDPKEATQRSVAASTKPCVEFTERFHNTGSFLKGTVFIRGYGNTWRYICPECSIDKYVAAGVCSGVFKNTTGHLSEGKRTCRCGKPKWTKRQREFQVNEILKELGGGGFSSWTGEFKGNRTKFKWKCKIGHENETILSNFLQRRNCKTCFANGFKNYLPARLYITRWKKGSKEAIKYGITNLTVASREHNQGKVTEFLPEKLYEFYHGDGRIVESCEKDIKNLLGGYYLNSDEFPRGYSETVESSESNINAILEIISKCSLLEVVE